MARSLATRAPERTGGRALHLAQVGVVVADKRRKCRHEEHTGEGKTPTRHCAAAPAHRQRDGGHARYNVERVRREKKRYDGKR
eukprot:scaffold7548_cov417-Prasinococcus_capsulatus_cf.AAC.3